MICTCRKCGKQFKNKKIRLYCFECKPLKSKIYKTPEERAADLKRKDIEKVAAWRKRTKERSLTYMGGKCIICGYDKCNRALEFHHLDPSTKSFGIGSDGYKHSWEVIKKELDKCILVCSNCHAEIHDGFIDDSIFKNKHLEYRDTYKEDQLKKLIIKDPIKKVRPPTKRPNTYIQLLMIIDSLKWNFCAVGRYFGVSDNAVRKWIKSFKKQLNI